MAARSPDAGGVATYAGQAFGAAARTVTGWFYFSVAATAQALVALTGVYYVTPCLGLDRAGTFGASGLILLLATAANMRGVQVRGRLQLGFSAVGAVGVTVFFAFFGWEAITRLSAEFKDPARDVPRSAAGACAAAIALLIAHGPVQVYRASAPCKQTVACRARGLW